MATDKRPIPPRGTGSGMIIDPATMLPEGMTPKPVRVEKTPFGKRAHGMDNPTSFSNGIYDAMSAQADKLHPVKKRR